jgi:histidinol-phosphate aminotransferase
MSAALERFSKYSTKYLGYNRLSEEIGIAVLKADGYYRKVAASMNADRHMYEEELGFLPGFKVYKSNANFILVKIPMELKDTLKKTFGESNYKIKFMDEPELDSHIRITIGRHEQNCKIIETIKNTVNK